MTGPADDRIFVANGGLISYGPDHQPGFTAHALCLLGDLDISRDRQCGCASQQIQMANVRFGSIATYDA